LHISADALRLEQEPENSCWLITLQPSSASSWRHGKLAGLPCVISGSGVLIEGAVQQAA
jgi:hypothetical protein